MLYVYYTGHVISLARARLPSPHSRVGWRIPGRSVGHSCGRTTNRFTDGRPERWVTLCEDLAILQVAKS